MSEGEDGRPCFKWRMKLRMEPTGEERQTVETLKEAETEAEERTKDPRDAEMKLLIMEYQKSAKSDLQNTEKTRAFWRRSLEGG